MKRIFTISSLFIFCIVLAQYEGSYYEMSKKTLRNAIVTDSLFLSNGYYNNERERLELVKNEEESRQKLQELEKEKELFDAKIQKKVSEYVPMNYLMATLTVYTGQITSGAIGGIQSIFSDILRVINIPFNNPTIRDVADDFCNAPWILGQKAKGYTDRVITYNDDFVEINGLLFKKVEGDIIPVDRFEADSFIYKEKEEDKFAFRSFIGFATATIINPSWISNVEIINQKYDLNYTKKKNNSIMQQNFIYLFWFALRIIGAIVCHSQAKWLRRSYGAWAVFGFFFPIIAMIWVFCLKPKR